MHHVESRTIKYAHILALQNCCEVEQSQPPLVSESNIESAPTGDYCLPRPSQELACQIAQAALAGLLTLTFLIPPSRWTWHTMESVAAAVVIVLLLVGSHPAPHKEPVRSHKSNSHAMVWCCASNSDVLWSSKHILLAPLRYPKITTSWDVEGRHINVTEVV